MRLLVHPEEVTKHPYHNQRDAAPRTVCRAGKECLSMGIHEVEHHQEDQAKVRVMLLVERKEAQVGQVCGKHHPKEEIEEQEEAGAL